MAAPQGVFDLQDRHKKAGDSCTMQKPSAVISGFGKYYTTMGDLIPG